MEEKDLTLQVQTPSAEEPALTEKPAKTAPEKKTGATAKKTQTTKTSGISAKPKSTASKTAKSASSASKTSKAKPATAQKPKSTAKKSAVAKPVEETSGIVEAIVSDANVVQELEETVISVAAENKIENQDAAVAENEEVSNGSNVSLQKETVSLYDDEPVAQFSVEAEESVVAEKPAEKSAEELAQELSDNISAEEKAKIEAAQQKADKRYHDILGDRRIKKPTKFVGGIIAAVIIILIAVVVVTKLPMFFNCMVPGGDVLKRLPVLMGETSYDAADMEDEIWNCWDYDNNKWNYWNAEADGYRPTNLPNDDLYTKAPYAYADKSLTKNCVEVHLRIGKKQAGYELSDVKYATVILYSFDSVDKAKSYSESKIEAFKAAGGQNCQYEFQDLLFYKLGMAHAETSDFIYDAWYNGGNYIEVYAPDAQLAQSLRTALNFNA